MLVANKAVGSGVESVNKYQSRVGGASISTQSLPGMEGTPACRKCEFGRNENKISYKVTSNDIQNSTLGIVCWSIVHLHIPDVWNSTLRFAVW